MRQARCGARLDGRGAQCGGRFGAAAVRAIKVRQNSHGRKRLNPALRCALQWWVTALQNGVPRVVPYTFRADQLFLTVSDGEGSAQVAVALWRPGGQIAPRITVTTVPEDVQQLWKRQKKQTIAEIEKHGLHC